MHQLWMWIILTIVIAVWPVGCARESDHGSVRSARAPTTMPAARAPDAIAQPEAGPDGIRTGSDGVPAPMAVLAEAHRASKGVMTARMIFHRQERLGLFKTLQPAERMSAVLRESPFSVRFDWLSSDSEIIACVYVENENAGNVLIHHRYGLFGGPGPVIPYAPGLAVVFQKAKLPITQFGPRRVMDALMTRVEGAHALGGVVARYVGREPVGPAHELCDHVALRFPTDDPHPAKQVDVYISVSHRLPVMLELWLDSEPSQEAGRLDARYMFYEIEINPPVADDEFRMGTDSAGVAP